MGGYHADPNPPPHHPFSSPHPPSLMGLQVSPPLLSGRPWRLSQPAHNTNSARGVGVRLGRVSGVLPCSCSFYSTSRSPQPIGNSKLIVTSLGRRTTRHPESARSAACGGWQRASRPYPCPQLRAWVTTMLSLILLIITFFNLPSFQPHGPPSVPASTLRSALRRTSDLGAASKC